MFAYLTFETQPEPTWRQRLKARVRRDARVTALEERRWGLKALHMQVTFTEKQKPETRRQRVALAMEHIAARDIKTVLLPEACEYTELLQEYGLKQPESRKLLPTMCVAMLKHIVAQRGLSMGTMKVAIVAPRLNIDAVMASHKICRQVKSLSLNGGIDTELMALQLRREYGVSVLEQPSVAQHADTDVYLLFDAPSQPIPLEPRQGSLVIEVGDGWRFNPRAGVLHINGAVFHVPATVQHELPPGVDKQRVMALLAESGVFAEQELKITALTRNGQVVW